MTSYLKQLRAPILEDDHNIVMTADEFWKLDDYTRLSPTGASVGRIWRKSHRWTKLRDGTFEEQNWFVWQSKQESEDHPGYYEGKPVLLV